MGDADEDFQYAKNRNPKRFYISSRFQDPTNGESCRFAHRVFPSDDMAEITREGNELVLRTTSKGVQQIKAKFFEDDRKISTLWLQRWSTKTGYPIGGDQFTLIGQEIPRLVEFLNGIAKLEIPHDRLFKGDFDDLRLVHLPDADARKVLEQHPELVAEFARSNITTEDIVALAYRRQELETFQNLIERGDVAENEWQEFFERNQWIFGYGLAYVFTTSLDGQPLENTIRGSSLIKTGKDPDGIMKTRAAISALCLVEIKKSNTQLLKKNEYRSGTWAPTAELSGAIAQSQENVRATLDEFSTYHQIKDQNGNPTGEDLLAVQPRSFLIVGNLNEFQNDHGVNVHRFRSFEDFRRNLRQPEILTFDELYERAKFIVDTSNQETIPAVPVENDDEIPF